MVQTFVFGLLVAALQKYLQLGEWVWWVFFASVAVDFIFGLFNLYAEWEKGRRF